MEKWQNIWEAYSIGWQVNGEIESWKDILPRPLPGCRTGDPGSGKELFSHLQCDFVFQLQITVLNVVVLERRSV
jgi:hypothetical protein